MCDLGSGCTLNPALVLTQPHQRPNPDLSALGLDRASTAHNRWHKHKKQHTADDALPAMSPVLYPSVSFPTARFAGSIGCRLAHRAHVLAPRRFLRERQLAVPVSPPFAEGRASSGHGAAAAD